MIARPRMEIQNSLFDLCEPVLKEAGYELVWAQVSGLAGRMKAALYIDKPGGVNVEDCAAASRLADPLIEGSGLFSSFYTLEVSSPGLDRPLFKAGDYERFSGRKARLWLRRPDTGNRKKFTGILRGLNEGSRIVLELEGGALEEIPLDNIRKAYLVYEWS